MLLKEPLTLRAGYRVKSINPKQIVAFTKFIK